MGGITKYKSALSSEANNNQVTAGRGPLLLLGGRDGLSMDMKLGLGAKAKLALTDSLNQLNSKLQLGTFPGVVQSQTLWSGPEMRVWMSVLFVGMACLYGNQVALPMSAVEVEEQLMWQRKHTVSTCTCLSMNRYGVVTKVAWVLCTPLITNAGVPVL